MQSKEKGYQHFIERKSAIIQETIVDYFFAEFFRRISSKRSSFWHNNENFRDFEYLFKTLNQSHRVN
jgi:hypothetical protein